jgi:hypothetical protein
MAARTDTTASRAAIQRHRIDGIEHPALMAATINGAERDALHLAIGWDQAAMAAERLALRAADVLIDDADPAIEALAAWLHPLALGARLLADQAAIGCLVQLAAHTTPRSDAGAVVRQIAAARYGIRFTGPDGDTDPSTD